MAKNELPAGFIYAQLAKSATFYQDPSHEQSVIIGEGKIGIIKKTQYAQKRISAGGLVELQPNSSEVQEFLKSSEAEEAKKESAPSESVDDLKAQLAEKETQLAEQIKINAKTEGDLNKANETISELEASKTDLESTNESLVKKAGDAEEKVKQVESEKKALQAKLDKASK